MKITYDLLCKNNMYEGYKDEFRRLWPVGCKPTLDNLMEAESHGFDVLWLARLLSKNDQNYFAIECIARVAHLVDNHRAQNNIDVLIRYVNGKATHEELVAAKFEVNFVASYNYGRPGIVFIYRAADRLAAQLTTISMGSTSMGSWFAYSVAQDVAWAIEIGALCNKAVPRAAEHSAQISILSKMLMIAE